MDKRTYYRKKRRKRRLKRTGRILLVCILLLAFAGWGKLVVYDRWLQGNSIETASTIGAGSKISNRDTLEELKEMAKSDERIQEILKHPEQYPEDLLDMLAGNEETADFVLHYPEKKDTESAEDVGEITKGEIPLLLQWDERWGYTGYGDTVLAVSGCGPTALAMVAAGLTGNSSITPCEVAQYAQNNGYYAGESGTSWQLMTEGGYAFGVAGEEIGADEETIFTELENGHPIICSMRPGDFTTTGHFIVLTGIEDGKIKVNDSNSEKRSSKLWEYDEIKYQIQNLWAFTAV